MRKQCTVGRNGIIEREASSTQLQVHPLERAKVFAGWVRERRLRPLQLEKVRFELIDVDLARWQIELMQLPLMRHGKKSVDPGRLETEHLEKAAATQMLLGSHSRHGLLGGNLARWINLDRADEGFSRDLSLIKSARELDRP